MSLTFRDTVKDALEDALRGFLMWYDPEEAEETRYIPYPDY